MSYNKLNLKLQNQKYYHFLQPTRESSSLQECQVSFVIGAQIIVSLFYLKEWCLLMKKVQRRRSAVINDDDIDTDDNDDDDVWWLLHYYLLHTWWFQ